MRVITLLIALLGSPLWAAGHVNILVYHHVAENTPTSTSVSTAQFREHLQLFKDEGFTVISLSQALTSVANKAPLPDKAIAISFDDGYRNIYDNAWPLLKEFGYPFTIFVATDAIDNHYADMLTWDQLRQMKEQGVTIANHSTDHGYLVRSTDRGDTWKATTLANIEQAQARLETELGNSVPRWFAYPYGEFTADLKALLAANDYIGFAQHSGGFWQGSDPQAIPRFAAAGIYANPNTLLTKLHSRPMPVIENQLDDMITQDSQPTLKVTLSTTKDVSNALNCFVNGDWQEANWESALTFSLQSSKELTAGRHRYNCTAKSKADNIYYWFSKPWLILKDEK